MFRIALVAAPPIGLLAAIVALLLGDTVDTVGLRWVAGWLEEPSSWVALLAAAGTVGCARRSRSSGDTVYD